MVAVSSAICTHIVYLLWNLQGNSATNDGTKRQKKEKKKVYLQNRI